MSEMQHHTYGPSALPRYEACPGFRPKQDPEKIHPVTASGSRIHDAMETGDLSRLETESEAQLVDLIRAWEEENLASSSGSDWIEHREVKIPIPITDLPPSVGMPFGTSDMFRHNLTQGVLCDYKGGYVPVTPAEVNIQLQAYVFGWMYRYPWLESIKAIILQPRINRVSFHRYTRKDLLRIEKRIQNVITLSIADNPASYQMRYDNCIYCARKADCPLVNSLAYRTGKKYRPDLVIPASTVHASEVKDGDTMGRLMDIATILGDWTASVKHHAKVLNELHGEEIKGYTPVIRSGRRTITNPLAARDIAAEFGVPEEEFLSACTVSPKVLTDRVREAAARGDKKKVEDEFTDRLRGADAYQVANPTTYLKHEHRES